MTIYASIFIGDYEKKHDFKEHNSGTSMSQMELLRTKGTRFCGYLQSIVIPRLKLGDKKEVKIVDFTIPGDVRLNEMEVGKI